MSLEITKANAKGRIYAEGEAKINLNDVYDTADAILSAYDDKATKQQAVNALINLFIDTMQEDETRDVMPPNRKQKNPEALQAEDLV